MSCSWYFRSLSISSALEYNLLISLTRVLCLPNSLFVSIIWRLNPSNPPSNLKASSSAALIEFFNVSIPWATSRTLFSLNKVNGFPVSFLYSSNNFYTYYIILTPNETDQS